jgi:citrate/tricarballylate utilization protein
MRQLEALVAEAEAARVLQICNACRYCEGFCAVFPAMTRRLEFPAADVQYLAHLCHSCGACLHACQYAPPHAFAVNVPRSLAQVRARSWQQHAWPAAFGRLYQRNGVVVAVVLALALALFLALGAAAQGSLWHAPLAGNFYAVFPHGLMVAMFGPVFGWAVLALGIGVVRFWRGQAGAAGAHAADHAPTGPALAEAGRHVLQLTYLDGGHGEGCHNESDAWTHARRHLHHATFYGFLLCLASTSVATLYHYAFGWQAPYALTSLPVLLGTVGGIGLVVGPAGLWWLHHRRHPLHGDPGSAGLDRAFIALLFAVSASGLALLAGRDTSAMALLLCLHLGCVLAFFATMPYGKFAHGIYRAAALLKWAIEKRQPNRLQLGAD